MRTLIRKSKTGLWVALFFWLCAAPAAHAVEYSDTARFTQGFGKVITAPFQAPIEIVQGMFTPFPPYGIVKGALSGTYHTVTGLLGGLWDMAGAAAPYAKYAFPAFL
jgi:hypothetical protein